MPSHLHWEGSVEPCSVAQVLQTVSGLHIWMGGGRGERKYGPCSLLGKAAEWTLARGEGSERSYLGLHTFRVGGRKVLAVRSAFACGVGGGSFTLAAALFADRCLQV
jgi:hypothetical protein